MVGTSSEKCGRVRLRILMVITTKASSGTAYHMVKARVVSPMDHGTKVPFEEASSTALVPCTGRMAVVMRESFGTVRSLDLARNIFQTEHFATEAYSAMEDQFEMNRRNGGNKKRYQGQQDIWSSFCL